MANVIHKVVNYLLILRRDAPDNPIPFIRVILSDDWRLEINFMEPADLPSETIRFIVDRKIVAILERASRYPWYVDILRNEGPLRVILDEDKGSATLMTGLEEPGEGDLDYFL